MIGHFQALYLRSSFRSNEVKVITVLNCLNQPNSVAGPGCLSRIPTFIHPGSRISDPGTKNSNKSEGGRRFVVLPFLLLNK
jgi:hypothetical protein